MCTGCTVMKRGKVKVGFSIDEEIVKQLDSVVESSGYLQTSRSELVDAILAAFFKGQEKPLEKGRRLIILRRKGKI